MSLSAEARQDIRFFHTPNDEYATDTFCVGCSAMWPCLPIKALNELERAEREIRRFQVNAVWFYEGCDLTTPALGWFEQEFHSMIEQSDWYNEQLDAGRALVEGGKP